MLSWLVLSAALFVSEPSAATSRASYPSVQTRAWVRTPVLAGDTVEQIAKRHGVDAADVRKWNELGNATPAVGTVLRLHVVADAPVLQPIYVRAIADDTWESLAARHGVDRDALLTANPHVAKRRRPPRDARLTVWVPTGVHRLPAVAPAEPPVGIDVPSGGVAIGKPHRGRLENGVRLPDSELYTKRFDRLCYGTSLAVRELVRAVGSFRHETGFDGEIFIGAMSRQGGRKLRPHQSHRTGRDVDIRMPALSHATGFKLERDEIDWSATWALVDALVRNDQVYTIFLERKLWQRLRRAALRTGASDEAIERAFAVIKHAKGHTSHIHVRFVCAPEATQCADA